MSAFPPDPFEDDFEVRCLLTTMAVNERIRDGIAVIGRIADKLLRPSRPDDDWDIEDVPVEDLREAILALVMCGGWDVERGASPPDE